MICQQRQWGWWFARGVFSDRQSMFNPLWGHP